MQAKHQQGDHVSPSLETLVHRRLQFRLSAPRRSGLAADLAEMETHVGYTVFAEPGTRTEGSAVGRARRILNRLLYPVLRDQECHARATNRVIAQLVSRVNTLERARPFGTDRPALMSRGVDRAASGSMFALEQAFRGTEEAIRAHQARYVPRFSGSNNVVDVGCGRGEFLELLRDSGVPAIGVDSDHDMVRHCRAKGLDVAHGDGIRFLQSLEHLSIDGVFCAQVIEHLAPADVADLLTAARHVLRPRGVLVVESVNPRSVAGLSEFFLDMTHVRPYDPLLIAHLMTEAGFGDTETVYSLPVEHHDRFKAVLRDRFASDDEMVGALDDIVDRLYGDRAYAVIATVTR